eukprot:Em0007g100a
MALPVLVQGRFRLVSGPIKSSLVQGIAAPGQNDPGSEQVVNKPGTAKVTWPSFLSTTSYKRHFWTNAWTSTYFLDPVDKFCSPVGSTEQKETEAGRRYCGTSQGGRIQL